MPSLKEVRNRIVSVHSTQQITKAMKMVSAAKLRRAQDAIQKMRPYASKLKEILSNLSESVEASEGGEYVKVRPANKVLLVAISSNRGLCGAFNSNIIRNINRIVLDKYSAQARNGNLHVLCIGKKATDFFSKKSSYYKGNKNEIYNDLNFGDSSEIAKELMELFVSGAYDRIDIVYNQFKNAAVQYVVVEQLLPVAPETKSKEISEKTTSNYIFEPNQTEIVRDLIPKAIKLQLFKALLDSHASEHGARMTAMSTATENANDLLKELRLVYNKARQATITKEILEIVGGAEALKG